MNDVFYILDFSFFRLPSGLKSKISEIVPKTVCKLTEVFDKDETDRLELRIKNMNVLQTLKKKARQFM